jgi:hypothetical protein
VDCLREVAQV